LPDSEIASLLEELRSSGRTTEANVDLPKSHLGEMGFAETPSEA
jgi:hypothetical protein